MKIIQKKSESISKKLNSETPQLQKQKAASKKK
jgi:hypothetical protein